MKLKKPFIVNLDLLTPKLIELRSYLGLKKIKIFYLNSKYLKGFRNNFSIFELTFSKAHLKKILKLIYMFHLRKQKILFINFESLNKNLNFKSLIYKYNHLYLSEVWFTSLLSDINQNKFKLFLNNKISIFKSIHKSSKFVKNLSEFLNLSYSPDLIVLIVSKKNKSILKEIKYLNKPSVVFANGSNSWDFIIYKIFGNVNSLKKQQFFYLLLKSIFTIVK